MSSSGMPKTAALVALATTAAFSSLFALVSKVRSDEAKKKGTGKPAIMKGRATLDDELDLHQGGLVVKPIGVVQSIYRLCVGTPRQGLLAPHARGRIELDAELSDAVMGLEEYSHVWIVFVFHLNTLSKKRHNRNSKVTPPALGGEKVGVLSTRTPHRPNPIGMTLCQLHSIAQPNKNSKKTCLEVSGLDLVDGTPVLDVKPYVPHYDAVPEESSPQVPSWVENGLATSRHVVVTPKARKELEDLLDEKPNCLEFYGPHRGDKAVEDTVENVLMCIEEVLSMDVRSTWQTDKVRKGKFQAERAERVKKVVGTESQAEDENLHCTQQLDQILVHYFVKEPIQHNQSSSRGSGAEDVVTVESIQLLDDSRVSETATQDWSDSEESVNLSPKQQHHETSKVPTEDGLSTPDSSKRFRGSIVLLPEGESKTMEPPVDADFVSLKTFWSEAASQRTPTGLVPEKQESFRKREMERFYSPSEKSPSPLDDVDDKQKEASVEDQRSAIEQIPMPDLRSSDLEATETNLDKDTDCNLSDE